MTTSSAETSPRQRRILFDECIGLPHVERLKTFLEGTSSLSAEIAHVLEFQSQGVWDEDWIPRAAAEGWIIISQDRGKGGIKKGMPLPRVCKQLRATTVILNPSIASRKSEEKVQVLLSVWPEILELDLVVRGSRFTLEPRQSAPLQGRLINRTSPDILGDDLRPPEQKQLF